MKFSKLLVLGAMLLMGGNAMAAIVDGVRQKPAPQSYASYEVEVQYYLYNTGAGQFFTAHTGGTDGPYWGTRASVNPVGQKVFFTVTDAAIGQGEGIVELKNYVPKFSKFLSAFAGGVDDIWCDNDGRADRFWTVTVSGDVIRIANAINETDKFLGWKGDDVLYLLADEPANSIDWKLVTPEVYEQFQEDLKTLLPIYEKAQELKAAIDEAKKKGIDVSAQEAVYLNESATMEELEAALAAVNQAIASLIQGSVDNPTVMTNLQNPDFAGTANGWKGSVPGLKGDGNHAKAEVAEHYNTNFDTYQNLGGMPKGVFKLNAKTFYRGTINEFMDGVKSNAYLYAAVGEDTLTTPFNNAWSPVNTVSFVVKYGDKTYFETPNVEASATYNGTTYYIPNNPSTFRLYYEEEGQNYYDTNLFFSVEDGNEATVGLKKTVAVTNDWSVFDKFSLTYYGNGADAYTYWAKEVSADQFNEFFLKNAVYTEKYLTAYKSISANANASNKAEALVIIKNAEAAADSLMKNIQLWKEFQMWADSAAVVLNDETLMQSYRDPVAMWYFVNGGWALSPEEFDNAQIEAAIAEISKAIDEAVKHPGTERDMTSMLKNPDFATNDWTGWTREAASGGNVAVSSSCAEAWNNSKFDIYQEVKNAPVGVYEISVQGFYRYLRGNDAWNAWTAQTESYVQPGGTPVFVYLNAKQTPFMNVFEEQGMEDGVFVATGNLAAYKSPENLYYANGMVDAAIAFSLPSTVAGHEGDKMYTQKAYGLVKEGDVMRIGVKGASNQGNDSWVIFDNFKLTWKGFQADVIKPILEEELSKANERAKENMSKSAYQTLSDAITAGQNALNGTDGEAMFNALSGLFDVDSLVTASVKNFADLTKLLDTFGEEIKTATDVKGASDPDVVAANALKEQIEGNLGNHTYDDSDIAGLTAQINEMITKLRIRNADSATDDNPVDFTRVINNPKFATGVQNWSGSAAAHNADAGNAEFFNTDYTFYQEISGLPAGTYRVVVNGFYRAGEATQDYALKDSTEYSVAYLFAEGNGKFSSKALTRLSSFDIPRESSETLTLGAVVTDESGFENSKLVVAQIDTLDAENMFYRYHLLANDMVSAGLLFEAGYYGGDKLTGEGNVVTTKVGEDGKLRIGLVKTAKRTNDWTCFDNWELWYFGTESTKSADNDPSGIEDVNTENIYRVEIFTLDGRKATAAQKGILIQKMTSADGRVMVKKIRK